MKIEPGDEVFVVYQRQRGVPVTHMCTADVARVGRKYGYIVLGGHEAPFDLGTGQSHHKDCNARINRWGFDVYHNREEWERKCHEHEEYSRLCERLACGYGRHLIPLTPEQVTDIHAILDREKGGE